MLKSAPAAPRTTGYAMNDVIRLTATREAGTVRRCHVVPHHGQYNVAQHSYGAVSLLLLLHPSPSLDLVKAVQWHDVAERWLGDLPAPAKWAHPELRQSYEAAEEKILQALGFSVELTEWDLRWLCAVDTLELWLWCREEEALGNSRVVPMREACEKTIEDHTRASSLPEPVSVLYRQLRSSPQLRLPDVFEEVLANGSGTVGA